MSEEFEQQLASLRRKFDSTREDAGFEDISRELGELTAAVNSLPNDVEEIRSRGYAFRSYLENKAEVLNKNWDDIRRDAQRAIDDERQRLRRELYEIENKVDGAEDSGGGFMKKVTVNLDGIESEVDELESRVSAAERRIRNSYETMGNDINSTIRQIEQINWFMDEKDEASFEFLAGEAVFLVAKAEWVVTGKGKKDPDGLLYLTDQRLLFEQKETTGKKLGLFGGKKEQELEWELPLTTIDTVEYENKGLMGGKDMLNFTLGSGAPFPTLTIEVKGSADNKFWVKQIQRMKTGEASDERAIEPDAELVEALRNAPTSCHVCGATLPKIMQGQLQVECEYCGAVVRL